MLIEDIKQNVLNKNAEDYWKFGLTIGVFALAAGAAMFFFSMAYYWLPVLIGLALLIIGRISPSLLKPVYIAWMSLAVVLGFIVTRVLLSLVFFLVFTPIGMIRRLAIRPLLELKPDPKAETYWKQRSADDYHPEFTERQY